MNSVDLEDLKLINNILKNREEPVNIFKISNQFNISLSRARILLNTYISQKNLLNEYMVLFSAEIIENNKIKTVILHCGEQLNDILNYKDNLLDFGVFAIYKKGNDFLLNDYTVFTHENFVVDSIEIIKINNISKIKGSNNVNEPNSKTIEVGKKNVITKSNPNNTEKNLSKAFKDKISILDKKSEIKSHETNDYGQEFYYEGSTVAGKRKSDNKDDDSKLSGLVETKKKKDTLSKKQNSNIDEPLPIEISCQIIINSTVNEKVMPDVYINELEEPQREIDHSNVKQNETVPKKIRKIRKVKKTNTYEDEKGYLKTIDEWEDEEYWTDEKPKPVILQRNNDNIKKPTKKVAPGQSSLNSFFKK